MNKNEILLEKGGIDIKSIAKTKLARLSNLAKRLELCQSQRDFIDKALWDQKGSSLNQEVQNGTMGERINRIKLKLRKLIEGEACWSEIKQYAGLIYELDPSKTNAIMTLELHILYGSTTDIAQFLETLIENSSDFYCQLKKELRNHLVLKLWNKKIDSFLLILSNLYQKSGMNLLGTEALYLFNTYYHQNQTKAAFKIYKRYAKELDIVIREYQSELKVNPGHLYLLAARVALNLDYEIDAYNILVNIDPNEKEYQLACDLLLELKPETDENGNTVYARKLKAKADWHERIKLFYEFFTKSRRVGAIKDRHRAALNELLKDPLSFVPNCHASWSAIATMLVENIDLADYLPNFFEIFYDNANRFHTNDFEIALWEPILDLEPTSIKQQYLKGIANLHYFLAKYPEAEYRLWQAMDLVVLAQTNSSSPLPFSWKELHAALMSWILKSPALREHQREELKACCRVASDSQSFLSSDVEEYIRITRAPSFKILNTLQNRAFLEKNKLLELKIISKKAAISYYTNQDLERMWYIACHQGLDDLGWRIMTVIHHREQLNEKALHPWAISGEKRSQYELVLPPKDVINTATLDMTRDERKFVMALLEVGPFIPELFGAFNKDLGINKPVNMLPKATENGIETILNNMPWLTKMTKSNDYETPFSWQKDTNIPPFIQTLPNTTWSQLFMRLSLKLGIASWGWSVTSLKRQCSRLIPDVNLTHDKSYQYKVGKWLRKLNPRQKNAWYDIATYANKLDETQGIRVITTFLLRIVTIIYQNHFEALASLKTMQAPLDLIREMENWLVSHSYHKIRQMLRTQNRIAIPIALHKLNSILKNK